MKNEQSISVKLPEGAENIRTNIVNGSVEISYTADIIKHENEKYFSFVAASKLSLKDEFLKHMPQTKNQTEFKQRLIEAINEGFSDFKAQIIDPSVDSEGRIFYKQGEKPGIGLSINWWNNNANKFLPGYSRLGTSTERTAFLAILIKSGYATWEQICDHSEELGHYSDSNNSNLHLETTGSRQVGNFYDLANTTKITYNKIDNFCLYTGNCSVEGRKHPLSDFFNIIRYDSCYTNNVGWLVLS